MYCVVCGRRLSKDAERCHCCGTPVDAHPKVERAGLMSVLSEYTSVGQRRMRVWTLCFLLTGAITLLAISSVFIPKVFAKIENKAEELVPEKQVHAAPVTEIPRVSGTIIVIPDDQLPEKIVTSEKAFSDESWERDLLLEDTVKLRLLRYKTDGDKWVNTHIFALYPDVIEAENFPECDTVSGWPANRIQISSTAAAPGCVVEAVRTTDGVYDHIYVLEIPTERFEEYEADTALWAETAILVDADTLAERPKPDAASGTDHVN